MMQKECMHVEYQLDPTSLKSIEMYCFLRSIEVVRGKDFEIMKKAYENVYTQMQSRTFMAYVSVREAWFNSIIEDSRRHKIARDVYKSLFEVMKWAK